MKKLLLILLAVTALVVSAYTATVRVYERGTGLVTVAAGDKIAVFARGTTKVFKEAGYPNVPGSFTLLATVTNREYVSPVFDAEAKVRVEADAEGAWYQVDATPDVQWNGPSLQMKSQRDPWAMTTDASVDVWGMLSGLITGDNGSGGNAVYTLPTGAWLDGTEADATGDLTTNVEAGLFAVNDSFDWVLINLSKDATADTLTVTASTGHSIVGNAVVNPDATSDSIGDAHLNSSATFRTRKTAANTFTTYRIN